MDERLNGRTVLFILKLLNSNWIECDHMPNLISSNKIIEKLNSLLLIVEFTVVWCCTVYPMHWWNRNQNTCRRHFVLLHHKSLSFHWRIYIHHHVTHSSYYTRAEHIYSLLRSVVEQHQQRPEWETHVEWVLLPFRLSTILLFHTLVLHSFTHCLPYKAAAAAVIAVAAVPQSSNKTEPIWQSPK